jgi:two-component system response regulator CpxR
MVNIGDTLHSHVSALGFHSLWKSPQPKQFRFTRRVTCRNATLEAGMKPKRTILCVDSNEQQLSIRKVMLETRGYRVLACTAGADALEIFKRGGIDLVLADLNLPGADGGQLIQSVKAFSPQTPAILLSSKAKTYDHDTRADVFLPKGMSAPAELLERIRMLLVRKRGPKRLQPHPPSQTSAA